MNLQEHIRRYLDLVKRVDRLFETVHRSHHELMPCRQGCDDCCSVYFELSLLEAFVVSGMLREVLPGAAMERVLHRAESVEPLFQDAWESLLRCSDQAGTDEDQLMEAAAKIRVPCPLNEESGCVLYEHRPITCRLYGVPQKIRGRVVSCPRSGFHAGGSYTTVDIDQLQLTLADYSREFLADVLGLDLQATPLPPLFLLPAALQTPFDREFFLAFQDRLP